ncbi:PilZ domain-containing protein [Uliginosibacterium gangwonense]|uniref:PilZ domain-containing protein n=1 Tax=Uliginosibacterium gangwonense TaxID=392736 RepID=UPI00036809C5|nr:PilZ domain-containing protein [Uliginosibacterium gangwonense]
MNDSGDVTNSFGVSEKRSFERRRVHWRMLILLPTGEKKPGYVMDVSEGGLRILSMYSFSTGSSINIAAFVPDVQKPGNYLVTSFTCKVIFQVLRGAEVQLGLEYVNLPEVARQRIRAAVRAAS